MIVWPTRASLFSAMAIALFACVTISPHAALARTLAIVFKEGGWAAGLDEGLGAGDGSAEAATAATTIAMRSIMRPS